MMGRLEQRLLACEAALDGRSSAVAPAGGSCSSVPAADSSFTFAGRAGGLEGLEERLRALEQRHQRQLEALTRQLEEAMAFARAQEARANALQECLRTSGHASPAPLTPRGSLTTSPHLSAALPVHRISAVTP
ncbi:unnamed protein product, partial [Polarella glacialis]